MLSEYFGDPGQAACGSCDNCLRQKKTVISKEEFNLLTQRILSLIKTTSMPADELLMKLPGVKKEKAWQVFEFLQAEQIIEVDKSGMVRCI